MLNRLSLKAILLVFLGGILALAAGSDAMSFFQGRLFTGASERAQVLTYALRNHMTADMMHDVLKGVVFQALHAAQAGQSEREGVQEDLKEVTEKFRASIAADLELGLPEQARIALGKVNEPLKSYISVAEGITRSAFMGRAWPLLGFAKNGSGSVIWPRRPVGRVGWPHRHTTGSEQDEQSGRAL